MREASKKLGKMRLVAVGRGSSKQRTYLGRPSKGADVEVVVRGVLPALEIAREFESADVMLFLRGAITPRGAVRSQGLLAGFPLWGIENGEIGALSWKLASNGHPKQDRESLTRGLVRVLSDPHRWKELHERNLEAQKNCFSWATIAKNSARY